MRSVLVKMVGLLAVLSLLAGCSSSGSTKFPEKQLPYLLAYAPGGPSDREARPTKEDLKASFGAMMRSSGPGFFLGLLPGFSPAVTTFIVYDMERRVSKNGHNFGKGAIEAVAAAEGGNNATSSGGFVPLAFGIPSGAPLAVLMGGLMMYGLQPGPRLFQENPQFVWAIIASMYIGNVILLVLNLPLVGLWAKIAAIPFRCWGRSLSSRRSSAPSACGSR